MRSGATVTLCSFAVLFTGIAALVNETAAGAARRSENPVLPSANAILSDDIKQIDLDGLKKLLQRDPKDTRPLLINFWATWCTPCREEFPDLVKIDADYRSKNLNFIAISLDDVTDIRTAVPRFLSEMKAKMPVALLNVKDPEPAIKAVDDKWAGQLPATFLYDKDGHVLFRHMGRIQPQELRDAIERALAPRLSSRP